MLLGRPWLHENGIVASTLHQCLKYYRGGVKKIDGDVKPFTRAESYFADAKFLENDEEISAEVSPSQMALTSKEAKTVIEPLNSTKSVVIDKQTCQKEEAKEQSKNQSPREIKPTPILRYVPKSRRKEGESPFVICEEAKVQSKLQRQKEGSYAQRLKNNALLPLPKSNQGKVSKPPTLEWVKVQKNQDLNKEKFDPNAYKLLAKVGYDFENPTPMGKVIEVKANRLNDT